MSDVDEAPEYISFKDAQLETSKTANKLQNIKRSISKQTKTKNKAQDRRNKARSSGKIVLQDYVPFEENEEDFQIKGNAEEVEVKEDEPDQFLNVYEKKVIRTEGNTKIVVFDKEFTSAIQQNIVSSALKFQNDSLYGSRIKRISSVEECSKRSKRSLLIPSQ